MAVVVIILDVIKDVNRRPIILFLAVLAIYLPIQESLLLYVGNETTLSFAVVPILFLGWFSGPVWALLCGVVVIVGFSLFKLISLGTGSLFEIAVGCASIIVFTCVGLVIGKLEELNKLLRKELVARKLAEEALEIKSIQLSHSNHELEQFAYIASHDLQEPLRKIISFSDRLVSKYKGALGEQGADYLTRMDNAAVRMQSLIEGLLTFSRVTTKGQAFTKVDLGVIVTEVLNDLETAIKESNAHVTAGELPVIDADSLQMRQLFQNLIGNALKYKKPDVSPCITITGVVNTTSCIITISDNGIGFEQKYAEQIFGVFQRLHARNSEYKGSGIGLSVCRKIVDRHAGSIVATGELDKGSTFTVTIPLHQQITTQGVYL